MKFWQNSSRSTLLGLWLLLSFVLISPRTLAQTTINVSDGDVSGLIAAINTANSAGTPHIIELATDGVYSLTTYYQDFFYETGLPPVATDITINGNGSTIQREDGSFYLFRLMGVNDFGILTLNDLTLRDGLIDENGGAALVVVGGVANLNNVLVLNNRNITAFSTNIGGALFNYFGTLNVTDSFIIGNTTTSGGGAIFNWGGDVNVSDTHFSANAAPIGAAIYHRYQGGSFTIDNSSFEYNRILAIYNDSDFAPNPPVIDATDNWWNDSDGPSGFGGGFGDEISDYVDSSNYLSFAPTSFADDTDGDGLLDVDEPSYGTDPFDPDADFDDLFDGEEINLWLTDPDEYDTDGDGVSDGEEVFIYGTDPLSGDNDSDNDGLTDAEEDSYGTDPFDDDTDDDGLLDGEEVYTYNTEPLEYDTDFDGLSDYEEIFDYNTEPREYDTDFDGLSDYEEIFDYNTEPREYDTDFDGLSDYEEVFDYNTEPREYDTDFDGLSDYEEVFDYNTEPREYDTDFDGLSDYEEVIDHDTDPREYDTDGDGLGDYEEIYDYNTDPREYDTDFDGLSDYEEVIDHDTDPREYDTDGDGLGDYEEIYDYDTEPLEYDTDFDGLSDYEEVFDWDTDPRYYDTDGDGLSDGDEVYTFNTEPREYDTDFDGLSDYEEVYGDSDPRDEDSDDDGLLDGEEVNIYGSLPNDPDTDDDTLLDGEEVNTYNTNPTLVDTDGDTLSDPDEIFIYDTEPDQYDTDSDGLNDAEEELVENTDPRDEDSDDDGLLDGEEVNTHNTDPLDEDSDDDTLLDGEEINIYNTNPNLVDTDGDTLSDPDEIFTYDTEPNLADTDSDGLDDAEEELVENTDPRDPDSDDDGLLDGEEVNQYNTDPLDNDSDDDTLLDGEEVNTYNTNPNLVDTDGDTLSDPDEIFIYDTEPDLADTDSDGLDDAEEELVENTDPRDPDSDDDGLLDGEEVNTYNTLPNDPDSDDDTLLDGDEINVYDTDPNLADTDGDGLDDAEEELVENTDPRDPDSDDDGLLDGEEVDQHNTDPLDDDSDDDTLLDGDEVNTYNTNPNLADTDGDTLSDPDEIFVYDTDPNLVDTDSDGLDDAEEELVENTDPRDPDSDDDGLTDGDEVNLYNSDPLDDDSDDDTLLDGDEVNIHNTSPILVDTDGDTLSDPDEVNIYPSDPDKYDTDFDGLNDAEEIAENTDALDPDSDDDGLTDGDEVNTYLTDPNDPDSDNDGLTDGAEVNIHGTNPKLSDSDGDGLSDLIELNIHNTDPNDPDSDNDGLTDGAEVNTYGTLPNDSDTDNDGLGDGAEVNTYGTLPNDSDTDNDGLNDGAEINTYNTDPNDSDHDDDGLLDGAEVNTYGTDPDDLDSDDDGLNDGDEVNIYGTLPNDSDTDNDGLNDGDEVNIYGTLPNDSDTDNDGLNDGAEIIIHNTLPLDADTDDDTLSDGDEYNVFGTDPLKPDTDDDTINDNLDNCQLDANTDQADADGDNIGDACDDDVDGDGILDNVDNCPTIANPGQEDADNDGTGDICEPGPVSSFTSTVSLSDTQIAADGVDTTTLTITLRDAANQVVNNIPVTFVSPSSTVILSPISGVSNNDGQVITTVSGTAPQTVQIQIVVDEPTGALNLSAPALTLLGPDAGISVVGIPTILAGQTIPYVITIENNGLLEATNVDVFAGVPLGRATIERVETPAGVNLVQEGVNSLTWLIPSLSPGTSYDLYVYARSTANLQKGNTLRMDVSIDAANDVLVSNNTDNYTTSIVVASSPTTSNQSGKLSVAYTAIPTAAAVGETVTLSVEVTNTTASETLYNLEAFAALKDTYGYSFSAISALTFTYPDPSYPGKLEPGETAIATFNYVMDTIYLQPPTSRRLVWVSADDSDPTDGSYVSRNDLLTFSELALVGPGLQVQFLADKTSALPGDTINFTVRVLNQTGYSESATNVVVRDLLNGTTVPLSPAGDIAPGSTVTGSFSYVVQNYDKPQLTAMITVEGEGTPSGTPVGLTAVKTIAVNSVPPTATPSPTPGGTPVPPPQYPDVRVTKGTLPLLVFPNTSVSIPLFVRNVGNAGAADVRLRTTLPLGVSVDNADGGIYDAATRTLTWTWSSLAVNITQSVTPTFITTNAPGNNLSLTFNVGTNSNEVNLSNNTTSINLPVIARQPASVIVEPVTRNYVIVDGVDSIQLRVNLFDQLGNPLSGVDGLVETSVSGVNFDTNMVTTDVNGEALVTVSATELGLAEIVADFGNQVTGALIIQRRPTSLTADKQNLTIGVGGSDTIRLTLLNTAMQGDLFNFSVTGLESLNPAWYDFTPEPLALGLGQFDVSRFELNIPAGECSAAGVYLVQFSATGDTLGTVATLDDTITITTTPPALSQIKPANGVQIGGEEVLFSWRSNTPGTGTIYIREQGESVYTAYPIINSIQDATFFSTLINLPNISTYEWYAELDTPCGMTSIASDTTPRTVERGQSASFADRSYSFEIPDNYNITQDVNGQPLAIRVRNDDPFNPIQVQVGVEEIYPDLILGFTGAGSADAFLTVQPGQTQTITLRVFTQETTRSEYALTLNLTSPDTSATDTVPLTLTIEQPIFTVRIEEATTDPRTLVTRAELVNLGETLTDLDIVVLDKDGVPAQFIIQPDIQHVYIQGGGTDRIPIEIIPLDVTDVADEAPYTIRATSRDRTITVPLLNPTNQNYGLSRVCGAHGDPQTIASSCVQAPGSVTFKSSGWYCTNKPDIELTIPWSLNSQVPITSITAGMEFNPGHFGTPYSHYTELFFNNVNLGGGIVPDTGDFSFDVPTEAVVSGATYQTVNLRSLHTNNGHYTVASDAFVTVRYGRYESTACYTPEELADAAQFPCADGNCMPDITVSNLRYELDGDNLRLTIRIGNGGTIAMPAGVSVAFYNGNPEQGGDLLFTQLTTIPMNPGEFEDVEVLLPLDTNAQPLYISGDDIGGLIGEYDEGDEFNLYATSLYTPSDLTVERVDTNNVVVNQNSLTVTGQISADVISPVRVPGTFDVTFFEDLDNDYAFTDGVDSILGVASVEGVEAGISTQVVTSVRGTLSFSNNAILVYVDSQNVVYEVDETNNITSSQTCLASLGCAGALPDLVPSYLRVTDDNDDRLLTVRIGNGGGDEVAAGINIAFYDADPISGVSPIGVVTTTQVISAGSYHDVTLTVPNTTVALPVWVVADDSGIVDELDELNNVYRSNVYISDQPNQPPVVDAGDDITITAPLDTATLSASVTDDLLPAGVTDSTWSLVSAVSDGVFIDNPDSITTSVTVLQAGTYTFRLTATDGELTGFDEVDVTYVIPPPPPVPEQVMSVPGCIAQPLHQSIIDAPTPIVLANGYSLTDTAVFYWQINHPNSYRIIDQDLTVNGGDTVAIFDTTLVANDLYVIQVTGKNASGDTVSCGVSVTVTGENKPGRVVISTTDLTVPIVGLPITIGRTYDSLERDYLSDFGYGWSLSIGSPRLEVASNSDVTVTLPNGRRRTFFFAPRQLSPFFPWASPRYIGEPGEYGKMTVTHSCDLVQPGDGVYYCFLGGAGGFYNQNVQKFHYEDPYGRVFTFKTSGKLEKIRDLNGNELIFSPSGIQSSTGINVDFNRDSQGRINTITAPDGTIYTYDYDANGDLSAVHLPDTTEPIEYTYYTDAGLEHFLKEGYDPLDNRVAQMVYFDNGRLQKVTDANGYETSYAYDLSNPDNTITTITNDDGGIREEHTDAQGNLIKMVDPLGRETTYSYDSKDNVTRIQNGAGEATTYTYDSKGNRTTVTNDLNITVVKSAYNQYGGPTQLTDAMGNAVNIGYNSTALPEQASDSLGVLGQFIWTTQGSPQSITDAENAETSYTYDPYGNVLSQTDARGNVTQFEYDDLGRQTHRYDNYTSVSDYESLTVTTYDGLGRTTQMQVMNDSSVILNETHYRYDGNGNRTHTIRVENLSAIIPTNTADLDVCDPITRALIPNGLIVTRFIYDATNQIIQTCYPDGTSTSQIYDFRGNVIEQTDMAGVKTCFVYDVAGQLTDQTTACDTTEAVTVHFAYDDAGRRTHTYTGYIDATTYESVSETEYDDVGRTLASIRRDSSGTILAKSTYVYDDNGRVVSTTRVEDLSDDSGPTTRYAYDSRGRRVLTTLPDGTITTSNYDGVGRLTQAIDQLGIQTAYTYDPTGNLTQIVQAANTPDALTTSHVYDLLGRRTETTDPSGGTTTFVYDDLSRVVQVEDDMGYSTTTEYDLLGRVTRTLDQNNNPTLFTYDNMGRTTHMTDADNNVSQTIFALGRVYGTIDEKDVLTCFNYDVAGRTNSIETYPAGTPNCTGASPTPLTQSHFLYDALGRQFMTTDANGNSTHNEYDALSRVIAVTRAYGTTEAATTQYDYDLLGRQFLMTDADGLTMCYEYDEMGRRVATSTLQNSTCDDAGALVTNQSTYDARGSLLTSTDANGLTTTYNYDGLARLTGVTNPMGEAIQYAYTYNATGLLTQIIDANNHMTAMQNNTLGQLIEKTWADNSYETYAYDPVGNMLDMQVYDENSVLVLQNSMTYDVLNRLDIATYGIEDGIADYTYDYSYTSTNRLDSVDDSSRGVTDYTYDDLDRPTNVEQPDGNSISYGYDPNGNRISMQTPADFYGYTYDARNRLTSMTVGGLDTTSFTYEPTGLLSSISRPNNVVTDYTYNERHFLTDIIHTNTDVDATIGQHSYTYDAVGNRLSQTTMGSIVTAWQYDDAYRLVSETVTGGGSLDRSSTFQYDASGNRTKMVVDGEQTSYTYNELDQLISDGDSTYVYDARGNLFSVTGENTVTYKWDARNMLSSAMLDGTTVSYSYDYMGQRIKQDNNGTITNYLWDELSFYGDVVLETDGSDNEIASYAMANGRLISQTRDNLTSYYLTDAIGSTNFLTDANGDVTNSYLYDAFGELVEATGTSDNNYLFAGQYYNASTELYDMRARNYSTALGRFLSRDTFAYNYQNPLELNRYTYALNNPINYSDPSGYTALFSYSAVNTNNMQSRRDVAALGGAISGMQTGIVMALIQSTFCPGTPVMQIVAQMTAYGAIMGYTQGTAIGAALQFYDFIDAVKGVRESYQAFDSAPSACTAALLALSLYDLTDSTGDLAGGGSGSGSSNTGSGSSNTDTGTSNTDTTQQDLDPPPPDNGSSCGVNSFSAETTVSTSEGDIPISEIELGDTVLAFNEETGEIGEYTVTATISHIDEIIIHLYIDDELIETTPEHPFYTDDGEWVNAGELEVGEQILSLDGDYDTVESVVVIGDANQRMYNLTINEAHTFFVSSGQWLVHNSNLCLDYDDLTDQDLIEIDGPVQINDGRPFDPENNPHQVRYDPNHPGRPDPAWSIDTTQFSSGVRTDNGGIRNRQEFWEAWVKLDQQYGRQTMSQHNLDLMAGKFHPDGDFVSPEIDDTWLSYFPEHSGAPKGDTIIHHHVDQGPYAVPVPQAYHKGKEAVWHP